MVNFVFVSSRGGEHRFVVFISMFRSQKFRHLSTWRSEDILINLEKRIFLIRHSESSASAIVTHGNACCLFPTFRVTLD